MANELQEEIPGGIHERAPMRIPEGVAILEGISEKVIEKFCKNLSSNSMTNTSKIPGKIPTCRHEGMPEKYLDES